MNQNPLVSVVIPSHNRAHMLPRCIDSVLKQTYGNCEILVVDDASVDDTAGLMKHYATHPVRYIRLNENRGACHARNVGIAEAKGEYVTFLDSDDEYLPEKVEKQVACFEANSNRNVVVVSCGREDVRNGKKYFEWAPKYRGNIMEHLLRKDRVGAGTPFLMVKREVFDQHKVYFDPSMPAGQDWDFLVRISQVGHFDFVAKPLVRVHHHSEDRVYNPVRAIKAVNMQYAKYQDLFEQYPHTRSSFVLRQAIMLYNYGNRQEAVDLLKAQKQVTGWRGSLWLRYFAVFPERKSFASKAAYSLILNLSFL